jgi:trehalose 6-phosphate phosphatase
MKLGEGKRVVEIRPPLAINKGTALHRFAERFALRGLVFAGDDRTDLDAVLMVARLQQEGLAALSIAVRQPETAQDLLDSADMVVEGVPGMVDLLKKMGKML